MSFKTPLLRSDMCDYRDAYLGVKRTITVQGPNVNDWTDGILTLKIKIHLDNAFQTLITHF